MPPMRGSSFRSRGGFGSRGRGSYSERGSHFPSSSHFDSMPRRSRKFISSYGHKSEMEMTKALVSSVLESGPSRGMRPSSYKQHSRSYHSEDFGHERKKYSYKDSDRPMREPRVYSESRRYPKEHRDQNFSRPSMLSKDSYKYIDRNEYPTTSMKRQRIGSNGSYRESKFPVHQESRPHFKSNQRFEVKGNYIPRGRGYPKREYPRFPMKASDRLHFKGERMLPFKRKRNDSEERRVKVNIRSSDRRQVAGEMVYKHGGDHVELKCPHCPGHEAITFKNYRFHLDSAGHGHNLNKLIRKHSAVLRKIRLQQRDNVRDIEDAMLKENPDKFRTADKEFCGFCKLVYKVFSSTTQAEHNRSRFHKMQVQYLRPFCKLCQMNLPSLMVYEHHTASIRHLRSICEKKAAKNEYSDEGESGHHDDKDIDFDMSNFVTMDAVGEDDAASLSDNEEITGKLEDLEAAIKESKADYKDSHHDEAEANDSAHDEAELDDFNRDDYDDQSETANREDSLVDEKAAEDMELLVEDYQSDDGQDLAEEAVGTDYLCEIEAMLCRLCGVAIRIDRLGGEVLDRHCRSVDHVNRFNHLLKKENADGRSSRASSTNLSVNIKQEQDDHSTSCSETSPRKSGDEVDVKKE